MDSSVHITGGGPHVEQIKPPASSALAGRTQPLLTGLAPSQEQTQRHFNFCPCSEPSVIASPPPSCPQTSSIPISRTDMKGKKVPS